MMTMTPRNPVRGPSYRPIPLPPVRRSNGSGPCPGAVTGGSTIVGD